MNKTLSTEQLQMLCNAAIQAAQEAGQWIEQFDRRNLQRVFKDAGTSEASQLVTEVDIGSEEIIRQRLQKISECLQSTCFRCKKSKIGKCRTFLDGSYV